jgi:hypothetical protein
MSSFGSFLSFDLFELKSRSLLCLFFFTASGLGLIYGLNPQVPTAKNGRKVILFEAY